jgi:hypothetical protein
VVAVWPDGVVAVLVRCFVVEVCVGAAGAGAVCPGTVDGTAGPTGAVVVAVATVDVAGGGTVVVGVAVSTIADGVVPTAATPLSFVSFTNANASSAPAIATIAPIATVGSCQFGVGASLVRAGAPHSRHQSWSGPIGDEQRGQRIVARSGTWGWPGSGGWVLTARWSRNRPSRAVRRVGRLQGLRRLARRR